LALLAATCSRIGDTLHEVTHSVFTQKTLTNFIEKKIYDSVDVRPCVVENSNAETTRSNSTTSSDCHFDRSSSVDTLDLQHNQTNFQHTPNSHHQQVIHPSLKIKTEPNTSTLDYNQNYTEGMHICPNIINETRMLESQARASFNKSCCHEQINSSQGSCIHQTNSPIDQTSLNIMNHHHHQQQQVQQQQQQQQQQSCQHSNTTSLSHIPSPVSSSSCLFQTSPNSSSQQQSQNPMPTLSHLPIPATYTTSNNNNNNNSYCDNSLFTRTKTTPSINPWQNQTVHRLTQEASQKSSCMLHESFGTNSITNTHSSHVVSPTSQERAFRTYSPPEEQDRQFTAAFRSPEYGPPSVESHHPSPHYGGTQPLHSPHQQQQSFDGYGAGSYETNGMDVKPDPYTLHPSMRQSMIPPGYESHSHSMNTIPNTQTDSLNIPTPLQSPHYLSHGLPAINYNAGYPTNFSMHQNPELVAGNPMAGPPEMVGPNFVDYQYQQQMFYSRENRRPRRIACTCPNCRDGENKTVTTKDGKQRKLHVCHILGCGKEYGKTSHLRAHLRWHAGERPFACNWLFCNKRFTRSDELQRHRRTHTGDKRFECSVCLKKFMRSDHLSKHMKTHQSQNKQGKDKSNDSSTSSIEKSKATVSKNTHIQQNKHTIMQQQLEKTSKIANSLGLPDALNL